MLQTPRIPLDHLPLRPSTLDLCRKSGFITAAEIAASKDSDGGLGNLAAELGLASTQEALAVYREVMDCCCSADPTNKETTATKDGTSTNHPTRTNAEVGSGYIITFCRELDIILRGGIPLGELTEIAGVPGTGKTCLATQLAVDVTIPHEYGGVQGGAVYIDTEGDFVPERCYTMAAALVGHLQSSLQQRRKRNESNISMDDTCWHATPQDILQNIHVFRAYTMTELSTVLHALPDFLVAVPNIRLIVVDSIAFPIRAMQQEDTSSLRHRLLAEAAAQLATLAREFQLAVVVTNQMTTQPDGGVIPALGASWAHAVTNRLLLHQHNNSTEAQATRQCELVKSARLPPGRVPFAILEGGIRGADYMLRKRQRGVVDDPTEDDAKRLSTSRDSSK